MALVIDVKLKDIEGLKKSRVNAALKRANKIIGQLFRKRYLPERFKPPGGRRLKYLPRAGEIRVGLPKTDPKAYRKYAPRKQRILRHDDPLVFSGVGRNLALRGAQKVKVTSKSIRILLPRKFNLRNPRSRISMSDEIRRVTDREAKELSGFLVKQIERELAREMGSIDLRGRVQSATISNL